jgi:hypothetical protein
MLVSPSLRAGATLSTTYAVQLLAAVACGLMIGIERGWKQRAACLRSGKSTAAKRSH